MNLRPATGPRRARRRPGRGGSVSRLSRARRVPAGQLVSGTWLVAGAGESRRRGMVGPAARCYTIPCPSLVTGEGDPGRPTPADRTPRHARAHPVPELSDAVEHAGVDVRQGGALPELPDGVPV